MPKVDALEVLKHYGFEKEHEAVKNQEIEGVDFFIGKEGDIRELTANMAGFGTGQSQKVTIEYDKGYGYFIVKRVLERYGAPGDTP